MNIITQSRLAVSVIEPSGDSIKRAFHLSSGVGTSDSPLRTVLILRHNDLADESTFQEADEKIQKTADELADALSQVIIETSNSSEKTLSNLIGVLEIGNMAAKADTYYSAIVALLAGKHFVASGIGNVSLCSYRKGKAERLISPSITQFGDSGSHINLMGAALGIGFSANKVRSCALQLAPSEIVVLGAEMQVDCDSLLDVEDLQDCPSLSILLRRILNHLAICPPLLAVISPESELRPTL
ncbi:MAG TPA: hypothetical protein VFC63_28805 [Blastocatellia bacterium]|nr:hypothetical protein [Blastocatellia bacterium]